MRHVWPVPYKQLHMTRKPSLLASTDRSTLSFVSIITSLAAVIPYVPIHPKYPDKRQLSILERANCSILIADLANAGVIEKLLPKIDDNFNSWEVMATQGKY